MIATERQISDHLRLAAEVQGDRVACVTLTQREKADVSQHIEAPLQKLGRK